MLSLLIAAALAGPECQPREGTAWAESVVSFEAGPGVEPAWADPRTALGAPDFEEGTGAVSLGNRSPDAASQLVVAFHTVWLTDGPGHDLTVVEAGPSAEPTELAVSADGETWYFVGVISGSTTSVDLEGHVPTGLELHFVRLRTASPGPTRGPWAGPDIDAVGLLNSCASGPRLQV